MGDLIDRVEKLTGEGQIEDVFDNAADDHGMGTAGDGAAFSVIDDLRWPARMVAMIGDDDVLRIVHDNRVHDTYMRDTHMRRGLVMVMTGCRSGVSQRRKQHCQPDQKGRQQLRLSQCPPQPNHRRDRLLFLFYYNLFS